MGKLRQRVGRFIFLRDRPLIIKLLVFSALLVVIPLCVVGFISYRQSSEVLQEEASQYSWQIIEQVKMHVEKYVWDFEVTTLKILNHPDMYRFLRMKTSEEVASSGIRKDIEELLRNMAFSRSDIQAITVILDDVQIVDSTQGKSAYPAQNIEKEYWYRTIPLNGEPKLVSRVIPFQDRTEPIISVVQKIISPHTLQPMGTIIIDVNFKRLQEIAEKVTIGRSGYMVILDSQGHYVYHPDMNELGKIAQYDSLDLLYRQESGTVVTQMPKREFLTFSHSSFLDWTLVTVMPYDELVKEGAYMGRAILLTVVIALCGAYLLGIGFAASLIRPIRRLQQVMRRVEIGDFSQQVEVESTDEIGQLSYGFNKMIVKLGELLEEIYFSRLRETEMTLRQKETELKVLQSQINPHFLYNSLETIRGMALEKELDDIADMSSSLARLLRYNLRNSSPSVSVRDELQVCELYLRIQKHRFEERLEFEMDIPEWAMDQQIVKFSLQPLVENCIIHGMEPAAGMTRIRITALRIGSAAFGIRIQDTGEGIDSDKLDKIRADLRQKDIMAGGSHIGIVNVHRRISYLFGTDFGMELESRRGQGTTVTVMLPFVQKRGERLQAHVTDNSE
ncbi:sensor histidine kinase [Paenibacillus sp. y28]|uniref:sensor histidine kinase n=1 Tax=Paenibacillus sp. y28 TaxID=3129110 RepID=UPI003019FF52